MALDQVPTVEQNLQISEGIPGTLAIDLGSTTTVVAFQAREGTQPELLNLEAIGRRPGQVPSLLWSQSSTDPTPLVGRQVLDAGLADSDAPQLLRDFKRLIGAPSGATALKGSLSAEAAAETLLQQIWQRLPQEISIERLVLTAPVEHYRGYRQWLLQASEVLPVPEVALVDEPTAAALGAGLSPGSTLLVVDMGGSTIDLSIVALEGGEGRAAPLAQLLRFGGRSLSNSQQSLRNARVLGKAGLSLGGRDLDRWIVNQYLPPSPSSGGKTEPSPAQPAEGGLLTPHPVQPTSTTQQPSAAALNAAERLKCRLNDPDLAPDTALTELVPSSQGPVQELRLNRRQLEALLVEQGLLTALDDLLEQALAGARQHGCQLDSLQGVLPVGGGAQLLLLRDWLQRRSGDIPLLEAPPVEAVAAGALSLTPGVRVRDVLQRGIALRCWDRRTSSHHWHPLFVAGQTWPSESPLTLVLAAGDNDQQGIDLVLGEPDNRSQHEVVFINGLPTLRDTTATAQVTRLESTAIRVPLRPAGTPGQDCLTLRFRLDDDAELVMEGEDLRTGEAIRSCRLGRVR